MKALLIDKPSKLEKFILQFLPLKTHTGHTGTVEYKLIFNRLYVYAIKMRVIRVVNAWRGIQNPEVN